MKFRTWLKQLITRSSRKETPATSLEETAELIKRSAFTSEPPREEFQAKLLEKLLRERRNQPVSMVRRSSGFLMLFLRSLTAVPVVASVLVVAIFVSTLQPLASGVRKFSELLIPAAYASDNFSIDATAGGALGVASSTSFVITSKQPIKREDLQQALTIVPALDYRLIERSAQEFVVQPLTALAPRTLYRIMIDSNTVSDDGITVAHPFSFAFEVGEKLRVVSTLPGDKTTGVPVKTGIEITLSHEGVENPSQYVHVTPAFRYAVETKGRKMIIKPLDSLKPGTIYTITVTKDLKVVSSTETLGQDVLISFETERPSSAAVSFDFAQQSAEFSPDQKPALPVYGLNDSAQLPTADAVVYRFDSAALYAGALEHFEALPYWSWYQRKLFRVSTTSLKETARFDLALERAGYSTFVHFPTTIAPGWYVADIRIGKETNQLMFQVSSWGIFSANAAGQTVVWINNLRTNNPVSGVPLTTVSGTILGTTNAEGVLTVSTKALQVSSSTDALRYVVAGKGAESEVVALSGAGGYSPYREDGERPSASAAYWQYVTTDRQVYQTGDTAKVWGFVKPRVEGTVSPGSVRITLSSGARDWYGDSISIVDKTVPLTMQSFAADMPLTTLATGYYTLQIFAGDTLITSQSLVIQQYEKPALTLTIKPSSYAVKANEHFSATIQGNFFDGTPAARVPLRYDFGDQTNQLVLDDSGRATIQLSGPYGSCGTPVDTEKAPEECQFFPTTLPITVRPQSAGYGEVNGSVSVNIFGADVYFDRLSVAPVRTSTVEVSTTVFTIDVSKLKDGTVERSYADPLSANRPNFVGKPAAGAVVDGVLEQTVYHNVSQGKFYNEMSKQMEERFVTVASTSVAEQFSVHADNNGFVVKRFATLPDVTYTLHLRTIDGRNFPEYSQTTFYGQSTAAVRGTDYYAPYGGLLLELPDQSRQFIPGETVRVVLKDGNEKPLVTPGKILYVRSNGRYVTADVRSTADYSFAFAEDDVPSTYLIAARFNAGDYQTTNGPLEVSFKQQARELSVVVTSTKAVYEPGEQAAVRVKVQNASGQPVVGAVNLNVVDEAYYAFNPESASPLTSLYASLGNPFSAIKRTHEYLKLQADDAEGRGGCFVAGTLVAMADGSTRSIESIKAGDSIKTFKNPLRGTYADAVVDQTFQHVVSELVVVNGTLMVTPEHRMFVNSGWQTIGSAKIGDVLLSAKGNPVAITSLKRVKGTFAVYNLEIKEYHTFIAGGYFVHNDKGGDRTNFQDTAVNLTGTTDATGEATFTFTLPDNITSWRATAQIITGNLYVGVSTTPIVVTKPVFVLPNSAPSYVAGDKPIVSLTAYGTSLLSSDQVQLGFASPDLKMPETREPSKPFVPRYIALPQLTTGVYTARLSVSSAHGNDAVQVPIKVISSRQRELVQTTYPVMPGLVVTGTPSGQTSVVVLSKERGSLYEPLSQFEYLMTDRLDDRLAGDVAASARRTYFGDSAENLPANVWARYQTSEHGIALLPYGGDDPYLSMLASIAVENRFDAAGLRTYWYGVLNNESTPREQVIMALAGLAALSEPVLLPLRSMSAVKDLAPIERSYVALGASLAGDDQLARSLYRLLTDQFSTSTADGRQLSGILDPELSRQTAGALALVGARLNEADSESWGKTLSASAESNAPSAYHLEQALYTVARLPYLKDGEQKFTMIYQGSAKMYNIPRGGRLTFVLPASDAEQLVFGTSTGKIVALVRTERPLQPLVYDPHLSLQRQYLVNGVPTTTFALGDMVEVRLYPEIAADKRSTVYELSDSLPSGLAFLGQTYSWSSRNDSPSCQPQFPYAVDGQEVKFFISQMWNSLVSKECAAQPYLSYQARVRMAGTFVAEPAFLQSFQQPDLKGYGSAGEITINTTPHSAPITVSAPL